MYLPRDSGKSWELQYHKLDKHFFFLTEKLKALLLKGDRQLDAVLTANEFVKEVRTRRKRV